MRFSASVLMVGLLILGAVGCGDDDHEAALPSATPTHSLTPTRSPTLAPTNTPTSVAPTSTPTSIPTPTPEPNVVTIDAPSIITEFVVSVQITTRLPSQLTATLNDVQVGVTGGPLVFTVTVNPGPPLLDANMLRVTAQSAAADVSATHTFQYLPPKARARRITDSADLIHGPLAHGQIGDFLLANAESRFIVQDVQKRDLYSVGAFGGNIIDAELTRRPGTDSFLEIQPALNIESVINAQTVEIVNDGQDGTAAIVRTCGPDDLLDFVNPSTILESAGLMLPPGTDDQDYEIEACTAYVLEPGKTRVKMITTVMNNANEEVGLYVGDYINGSGELEQWTSSGAGLGEQLTNILGVLSYIGYGEATGVDYALVPLPIAGAPTQPSTFFTAAGVSYIMQNNSIIQALLGAPPVFKVAAHGSNSYSRFFGVGDGSGSNAIDLENEVKGIATGTLQGCVTAGGAPARAARVSVIRRNGVVSNFVTDETGCYQGSLPAGVYSVGATRRGSPNENAAGTPPQHAVTIVVGAAVTQDFAFPATGRVRVEVVEDHGGDALPQPVPARVSIVGFDPSPEVSIRSSSLTGTLVTGLYRDFVGDPVPFGLTWLDYTDANGVLEFDLEPGEYQVFVSRGVEYSLFDAPLNVSAGETTAVSATLAHIIDTSGFVSSDFHVHGMNSADSRVSHSDRVRQFAGEGVDNVVMTDHHSHTDLNPLIAQMGFTQFLHATIGEEITTWDYGHFNAYPLLVDPTRPSRGSTDWAVAAPPGRDFPAYGAYSLSPAALQALATSSSTSTPDTTIQINHIDSFFAPLQIDTSLVPPHSFLPSAERLRFRLDPNGGELFQHYKALELWNGSGRGAQQEFLTRRIGVWANHLNQGLLTTFIADTDTHEFRNLNTAGARTWTAAPADAPASVDPGQVARAVNAGKAVGGQGVYVQARLRAADGSNGVADFSFAGSTLVTSSNRGVNLEIDIQAPAWAEYDRIDIYANALSVPTLMAGNVPVLFTATPTRTLSAGTDFTISNVDAFPGVPGAHRLDSTLTIPFENLPEDTWFVVVVKGTDGRSRPMFPVMVQDLRTDTNHTLADLLDGNLDERGTLALGVTNALYADVDGVAGFQAPLAP